MDKNCRIGDDVRINGGDHLENKETDTYFIKDGIVVWFKPFNDPETAAKAYDEAAKIHFGEFATFNHL